MSSCNLPVDRPSAPGVHFQWSQVGTLPESKSGEPEPGLAGPVAGISHQRLLIGGGSNFPYKAPWEGGAKRYYDEMYLFENKDDSLVGMKRVFNLPYAVAYSANCTTAEGIVVAGGENEHGAIDKVLLINWKDEINDLDIRYLPNLPLPLTNGMITVNKGIIYFAGGENKLGVSDRFYALPIENASAGWQMLPDLPHPVTNGVLLATDSSIYLVGGRKKNADAVSDLYRQLYVFNPNTQTWASKESMPYALSAHTGIAWNDSTLLVFSGDRGNTFHATEELMIRIAHEKDAAKKQQLMAEKSALQKSHPGFSGVVLAYNTHTDRWTKTDSIPFPGQVTTTALQWKEDIIIPCGEIRAGVRTPRIIMGKPLP